MKCSECNEHTENINLERVPCHGGTRIKQICDECLGELQDYWDHKREESRLERE